MAAAGIIVLHFSPRELRREPAKVAELIKGALNRGLTRPSLPSAPSRVQARFNEWPSLPHREGIDRSHNRLASSARRLVIEATYPL
jgi:hypothetical protein